VLEVPDGHSTPPEAVRFLLDRVKLPMPILDPGCGSGSLLVEVLQCARYQPLTPGQLVVAGVESQGPRLDAAREALAGRPALLWPGDFRNQGPWRKVPWGCIAMAPPTARIPYWWTSAAHAVRDGGLVACWMPLVYVAQVKPAPVDVLLFPKLIDYGSGPHRYCWGLLKTRELLWRTE